MNRMFGYEAIDAFCSILKSMKVYRCYCMILLGFRYLASSIPSIVFAGVGIGVGFLVYEF